MKIQKILERLRKAAPFRHPLLQIVDVVWHKLRINTHPADYYLFEFYKGGKSWEEKKGYIGRYGSYYWPYDSIAIKDMIVLTNKYVQKHMLCGMGLPAPELLAAAGRDYSLKSYEQLKGRMDEWDFDILIKPISSTGGLDVVVLELQNGRFHGEKGEVWTTDHIWGFLERHFERGCLIERRMSNVGQTSKIYPHSLNTFRVITIRTMDGRWHIPFRMIKFGSGGLRIDNIDAGGIMVLLDEKGVATQALGDHFKRPITHHPDTGLPLIGFKPEGFEEVIALSLQASKKFAMFGTVGWDIAYTTEGPMIIEGNTLWGTNYQLFFGPVVRGELAQGLKKRPFPTRYPRDRIFPKLQKRSRWPWHRTRWWA